jgi:hypothetical protein
MQGFKFTALSVLLIIILVCFSGCGNSGTDSSGTQANSQQTEQTVVQSNSNANETVSEIAEETLPTADPKANGDALLGSWKDISADDIFADITKTETGYQYEDSDGKYDATFLDGVLKVKVSDTDTADVYIDPSTGHMFLSYQGGLVEYEKK